MRVETVGAPLVRRFAVDCASPSAKSGGPAGAIFETVRCVPTATIFRPLRRIQVPRSTRESASAITLRVLDHDSGVSFIDQGRLQHREEKIDIGMLQTDRRFLQE